MPIDLLLGLQGLTKFHNNSVLIHQISIRNPAAFKIHMMSTFLHKNHTNMSRNQSPDGLRAELRAKHLKITWSAKRGARVIFPHPLHTLTTQNNDLPLFETQRPLIKQIMVTPKTPD